MAGSKPTPTADAPELGAIELFGITLSEGERWEQDGDHIFRSTEVDVIVAAPSFEEGLARFGASLIQFAVYLAEIEDPAENEIEMLRLLQPRVAQIAARANAILDELQGQSPESATAPESRGLQAGTATRRRSRGDHGRRWQPTAKRRSSSRLSLA